MQTFFILVSALVFFVLLILICFGGAVFHIACSRKCRLISKIISTSEQKMVKEYSGRLQSGRADFENIKKREITITSFDNLSLHGYLIEGENPSRTIICVHGYHGSPTHDFGPVVSELLKSGNLLLVDQRAHGKSEGRFITFGIRECRDCKAWAQFLMEEMGEDHPVYLSGVSMGATSVLLASALRLPPNTRGIIADCGFTSPEAIIKEVAHKTIKTNTGILMPCVDLYCRIFAGFSLKQMNTASAMRQNRIPILFVHGMCDRLVPHSMTQAAFDACTAPKFLVLSETADHAMSYFADSEKYNQGIKKLFAVCEK